MSKTVKSRFSGPDLNLSEFCKGQSWLIYPPAFEEMYRRLSQENTAGGLARFAVSLQPSVKEKQFYDLVDGVAVIPVAGSLTKRESFSFFFFGGTTYGYVQSAVKAALKDDEARAIVLKMDSPGGVVNGVEATAQTIFNARDKKPVVAFADGMMASAAYWIGSAATEVIAGKTADVGSIGVLMVHDDWSKYNENMGISVTYLTAGRYKALGNPDEPLSDLARQTFQAELDYLYTLFVESVALNRGVESAKVLSDMADGRIFIGQQAADAGLVDRIGDFELALERASALADDGKFKFSASTRRNNMTEKNQNQITLLSLEQDAPELLAQIREAAAKEASDKAYAGGVDDERRRVLEILGADADAVQTKKAIADGIEANAAFKIFYEAEKAKRAGGLKELEKEATPSAGHEDHQDEGAGGDGGKSKDAKTQRREWKPVLGPAD